MTASSSRLHLHSNPQRPGAAPRYSQQVSLPHLEIILFSQQDTGSLCKEPVSNSSAPTAVDGNDSP